MSSGRSLLRNKISRHYPKLSITGGGGLLRGGASNCAGGTLIRPPLNSYYLEQGSFKVQDTWIQALKFSKFSESRLEKVKDCNKEGVFLVYECPSEKHFHRVVRPYSPCNDRFCLYDAGRYSRRKGIDVYRKLTSLPVRYYAHYVFTTPSSFWDSLFTRENANRLKKVARKSLNEFYGLKMGGVHRTHVWGDKEPEHIGRREVHTHCLIPLLGFDKKGRIVKPSRFRRDLPKLRGIYKKNFCKEFGFSFDGEIVVNYSYKDKIRNPEKLMNCSQYVCRPPLELPLREGLEKITHFGVKRLMKIVEKFEFYDGYRSLTWWGFMACHVVRRYLKKLNFTDREASSFFEKHEKGTCPICGLKMGLVAVYYRNRLVLWKEPLDDEMFEGLERVVSSSGGYIGWLLESLEKEKNS